MATIAEYLNKLVDQKNTLADNLVTKGVTATHEETLDTLVPKVLEISGGGSGSGNGIYPIGEDGRPTGDVIVPDGVTSLHQYVFCENNNISSVNLPNTLTALGKKCFYTCANLTSLTIPDNVTDLGEYGCYKCTALTTVNLPKNLSKIGDFMFQYCSNLDTLIVPDDIANISVGVRILEGTSVSNEAFTKLASKVTTIYQYAFAEITSITEVTTNIVCSSCFDSCSNLQKVTILNPLSSGGFGQYVFRLCKKLTTVILPENATTITSYMFDGNSQLQDINFPKSITTIGNYAFNGCSSLYNLSLPQDISFTVGDYSFANTGITDDDVQNILLHATSVGAGVFKGCSSINNVEISINSKEMFRECTNLVTAILNDITSIDRAIFYGCTSLKTVFLPSTITEAVSNSLTSTSSAYYVFYNCTALEDVQLGQDWNMSLRLNVSNNLTVDSMVAMFNSLKDLTGETAKVLTLGATNLAKLTDEQKAIATNKNWTLA